MNNTLDLPDNYSGQWKRTTVRNLFADIPNGVWHLGLGTRIQGTYCTQINPMQCVDLAGVKLHYKRGGYIVAPRAGLPVGNLMPEFLARLHPMTYKEQHLEVCPNCLSMAAVQAEMLGQNKYPIKKLLDALRGTRAPATEV